MLIALDEHSNSNAVSWVFSTLLSWPNQMALQNR